MSMTEMEKSNYKEWSVDFNGKIIKVSNWWNWEGKGSADLYLDNEHLDQNTEMLVNPNKPMLSKSEFSNDIKSIEEIAEWIKRSMEKLKIKEISFMGHSQGCLVGLEFASRFPKLIKSLVLVAGSYELPVNPALIDYADGGDMKSVELMMKWGYEGVKKFIGGNPVQKIIVMELIGHNDIPNLL